MVQCFGKISDKYDILTVKEKRTPFIGNNKERMIEMDLKQRELEAKSLKTANMLITKWI